MEICVVLSGNPPTLTYWRTSYAPGGMYSVALQTAATSGSIGGVRFLLRHGADIHRTGGKHFTVLQAASVSENYEVLRLLLEKGAYVNTFGGYCHSALHAAVLYGRAISCELLMKNGAHWSLVDRKPSHLAEWRLYNACEVLQNCRVRQERGWPKEDSESEWSDVEGDEIDKDEDDDDSDEEEEGTEEGDDDDEEDNAWKANVEEISYVRHPLSSLCEFVEVIQLERRMNIQIQTVNLSL
ncbi:hypothetical protein PENFLA_c008G09691 [Penicillium flavigenum]|uniref:Uncharacterized protein n=1 Tax=Penicillium flavigenum TaxID=254877 RepID=A0A1V6TH73_9EURO|nr:hypothetical protein PENFLA_c008G09691 [Penicillium flavigenum]